MDIFKCYDDNWLGRFANSTSTKVEFPEDKTNAATGCTKHIT